MRSFQTDADSAVQLAADLLRRAAELQTPHERRQQAELDRMINQRDDKATLVEMTDQAFRTHTPARVADQLTHLLDMQGVPRFFSPLEQALLKGFQSFGEFLPGVAVPLVKEKMRRETANVILPAEPDLLAEHLSNRQSQGVQMNVNLLGEAILGEGESQRRLQECIATLRLPEVRCLSVKISTLYSQISSLARSHTIAQTCDRLEQLYRAANRELDPATRSTKFVYLDMEEYRDLYLTADILCETLGRPGLDTTRAGIALQAYIPDSYLVMQRLIDWSGDRVNRGGLPLTIRLVKGANMEMERVEASIHNHPQAPYQQKIETDANYKRMLHELVDAADKGAVRVGLASHNLFDVALGMVWAESYQLGDGIQYEMLEGMANHQRRAISERDTTMLLYAPACRRDGFLNAIGYLIRRLDENTGRQNFLRHAFRLHQDKEEFDRLAADFRDSVGMMTTVDAAPRRCLDRHDEPIQPSPATHWSRLNNEPDTDWAVPANSKWAAAILDRWITRCGESADHVELSIAGERADCEADQIRHCEDPSRPDVTVCRYESASLAQVRQAVALASENHAMWGATSPEHRHELLRNVAQQLRQRRGDLIGAMVAEAGKTILEADPEVSEAIDFCEFYPLTFQHWDEFPSINLSPRGVVAVVTPWNFPLAIPCGGIAAALAAGNQVILKPAAQTVLVASLLCQAFWDAGIPRQTLQLIPCADEVAESGLVRNEAVDAVILTGGTSTAQRMLATRPGIHLLAETGGKNATIVTAMADRDLAIKHVVQSAFGHSGQKCSATSLLLLENEVFADTSFRTTLADAVESLQVGPAWDPATRMGPLIGPPDASLQRGLHLLEEGESWLVKPENVDGNPNLFSPGVKWNLRRGGFTHLNELFGPVLGVMSFTRLEEAIEIVRRTGYGLTSGLESLDDREITLWRNHIRAGNLYVNRPTTGAIVLRQPFGGVGLSAYGPGLKAGGPHYVLPLMHVTDSQETIVDVHPPRNGPRSSDPTGTEKDVSHHSSARTLPEWIDQACRAELLDSELTRQLHQFVDGCREAVRQEFSQEHDTVRLVGQDNLRCYHPVHGVTIRVDENDSIKDALVSLVAAISVEAQVTVSLSSSVSESIQQRVESIADLLPGLVHPLEESPSQLADRIVNHEVTRLRTLNDSPPSSRVAEACATTLTTIVSDPVLKEARIETLRYLVEQSISHDYHRYGNLGRRADEPRRPVD